MSLTIIVVKLSPTVAVILYHQQKNIMNSLSLGNLMTNLVKICLQYGFV